MRGVYLTGQTPACRRKFLGPKATGLQLHPRVCSGLGSAIRFYPFLGLVHGKAAASLPCPPPFMCLRNAPERDGPRVQCRYAPY